MKIQLQSPTPEQLAEQVREFDEVFKPHPKPSDVEVFVREFYEQHGKAMSILAEE